MASPSGESGDRQKAIERVKKLRALAADGAAFEGERAACQAREARIMEKFSLTEAEISGIPPARRMEHVWSYASVSTNGSVNMVGQRMTIDFRDGVMRFTVS